MVDVVVRGQRVVVDNSIVPASVHVRDGVTVKISSYDDVPAGVRVIDAGECVLMGGLVDSHVHVNEPGRTEWEGFETATKAAAAGGVTTIVDMPLNSSPVTTTHSSLLTKIQSMEGKCWVDVALLGGIIPGNTKEVESMVISGGVVGFKCFMVHSGIDEFPAVTENDIRDAMTSFSALKHKGYPIPYMFHAEVAEPIDNACSALLSHSHSHPHSHPNNAYATFLASRPREAENIAISTVARLAEEYQVHSHIVHLSSSDALDVIRTAQSKGVPLSVETTFHYLHFASEHIPDGRTDFKCCPPIRETDNRERLWGALEEGVVGMVVSDHSPCTSALKKMEVGDFMRAWGGIASLQLGLHIMWSDARKRGYTVVDIQRWMSENTSRLVYLEDKKGPIKVGRDADMVIWDPDAEFVVDQSKLLIKNKLSPYSGEKMYGRVEKTILRGEVVYENNTPRAAPSGKRVVSTRAETTPTYPTPLLPPIQRLNALPRHIFQHAVNLLFETAPPLFEPLYAQRPYETYISLIDKAKEIIRGLPHSAKVEVINAHPRIGLSATSLSTTSSLSYKEQGCHNEVGGGGGVDKEMEKVYEELRVLNEKYEEKFGFKFVVFVAGRPKSAIIPVLQERLEKSADSELELGLSEMLNIASDRLKKLSPSK